jgi:hypothetical protein
LSGLKLYEFEDAYIQIEPKGKKYYLKEYDEALAKETKKHDEGALEGKRESMEMQLHLVTGIPIAEIKKMAQWKLNEISKYCIEKNTERKKKDEKPKKSE